MEEQRRRLWRILLIWGLAAAIPVAWVLFVCGGIPGMPRPMWNGRATLDGMMRRDLATELPAGAVVERSAYVPGVDPSMFWRLRVSQAEREQLITRLRAGASYTVRDAGDGPPPPYSATPDWWDASNLPGAKWLEIRTSGGVQGCFWFYSTTDDRVYAFWFDT
jgi:hypothetical protein